jgi:histidinol-phosphate aminotransferase
MAKRQQGRVNEAPNEEAERSLAMNDHISRREVLRYFGAAAATPLVASDETGAMATTRAVVGSVAPPTRYANQNAYGASARAVAAVRDAPDEVVFGYGQTPRELLRTRLAEACGVASAQVVLGCGSTEILNTAAAAFLAPGKKLVTAQPTCELLSVAARAAGAKVLSVPLAANHAHDLGGMLKACDGATSLVYICSPHNPTGAVTRRAEIDAFLERRPAHSIVVIDEAYHEYVLPSPEAVSFIERAAPDDRVIVVRTFSKIHGLAGLRVGYAVTSRRLAEVMTGRGLPLSVSGISATAAIAALDDHEHVRASQRRNVDDRQEFYNQANARMLRVLDSQTNFVMLDTARPAVNVVSHFRAHGLMLPAPPARYDRYVRVSMGTSAQMSEFWKVWDLMPVIHSHS